MRTEAGYYDGLTAESTTVMLSLVGHSLQFQADGDAHTFNIADVRLISPIGRGVWVIELGERASLHFRNDDFGNQLSNSLGEGTLLRRLEGAWHWAVIALVVAVAGTWVLLTFGVPVGARYVAFAIPADAINSMGDDGLGLLDDLLFHPSELPEETKVRVAKLFADIQDRDERYQSYRLEFRASEIGANAFAIPGGIVVITDDMVGIAQSDDEISAVLAHEVGHLIGRHGLRILLQDSASALIIAGLTGDLTNVTALSATLPTVLMQAKYSRDFEREADEFAFDYLESSGIRTDVLQELLLRLDDTTPGDGDDIPGWLSSHPQAKDRMKKE
jgi:Zn-dependent protease with chaperone function